MEPESISSENLSKELAYLLGVYLTDGSFNTTASKNGNVHRTFQLGVIDRDFAEFTLECCKKLVPETNATVRRYDYPPAGFAKTSSPRYQIGVAFGKWSEFFLNQTGSKHHLPYVIWKAPKEIQKWFVAGAMDGDGWITRMQNSNGTFQWRCGLGGLSEGWVWEFRTLLQQLGVHVREPDLDFKGRPMVRLHFNFDSFVDSGLFFMMKRKSGRLDHARKELAEYRSKPANCTTCGKEYIPSFRAMRHCGDQCKMDAKNASKRNARKKLKDVQRLKDAGLKGPRYSPNLPATEGPTQDAVGAIVA